MHRVAAVALFVSLVVAAVVAFQLTIAIDEAQPAGTQSAFSISEINTPTKDDATSAISATADELGHNIFKIQPDPDSSAQRRILFAFVGDQEAFQSHGGFDYPEFSAQATTTVIASADDLTTEDLRGRYVTDVSPAQMTQLLTLLGDKGILAEDDTVGVAQLITYSVQQGNLAGSFVTMFISLGLAIFYSVARNRKTHAVRILHGHHPLQNLKTEISTASATFLIGVAALVTMILPALAFYNGLQQAPRFFGVLLTAVLVLYSTVALLVTVALWSLPRMAIPQVLKGEQVLLRNGVLAAGAQVAILAIVLATTSAAMTRIEAIQESFQVSDQWSDGTSLYALRLGIAGTHEDDLRAAPEFQTLVKDLEKKDQVMLVSYAGQSQLDDAPRSEAPEGNNSLIVNNQYLERQVVRSAEGQRITDLSVGTNEFTLLVPQSYRGDHQALLQLYSDYFRGFACTVGTLDGSNAGCDPRGSVVVTKPDQELFTYKGTKFLPAELQHDPTMLRDPVVAVVAADSGLLSPFLYFSYASQDDVLFSDPAALNEALDGRGISWAFQGIDNAADAAASSRALSEQELRMDAFSLPLGWAVLVLALTIMAMVYCDRRKRPMFVQLIHGYSFAARHWRYLTASLLLSLVGIGIAGVAGKNLTSSREFAAAGTFIVAQLAISFIAVKLYETRFRADFIKRS